MAGRRGGGSRGGGQGERGQGGGSRSGGQAERGQGGGSRGGDTETGWLTSAVAARRLGIKRETLYAYVSRGMLTSRKDAGSRESRFDPAEISGMAEHRRSGTGRAGATEVVIDSALTLLDPAGRLWFRGWDAEVACRTASFEEMAEWLWTSPPTAIPAAGSPAAGSPAQRSPAQRSPAVRSPAERSPAERSPAAKTPVAFAAPADVLEAARRAVSSLGPATPPIDRIRVALAAAATADPLRFDRRPDAVAAAGRRIVAVMVDALATPRGAAVSSPEASTVAERLWSRLSPMPGTADQRAVLNAALVVLADHEMASSTLAARVAASTWADPYLVVTAGLATLGGPLHGSVGDRMVPVLRDAVARGAAEAIAERWRLGENVWGFGHRVYTNRDPRAETLWLLLQAAWPGDELIEAAGDVVAAVTAHGRTFPNVDLMLGALVGAAGMVEGSAEVIFAVARTVGWLAHAIEEYPHALRFRLRAAYTGPAPASGMRPPSRSR
jgi:citrate synthase